MPRRSGRPSKDKENNSKEKIISTALSIIREKGADALTVRNVCKEADLSIGTFYHFFRDKDDLLMFFLQEPTFDSYELTAPGSNLADRISELYFLLIHKYMDLGLEFVKSFYSTSNQSLLIHLGDHDGFFIPGTILARSEDEIQTAINSGLLDKGTKAHELCLDICTILKGCILDWCLADGFFDIEETFKRLVNDLIYAQIMHSSHSDQA